KAAYLGPPRALRIASAIMLRAELPVQRNNTVTGLTSLTRSIRRWRMKAHNNWMILRSQTDNMTHLPDRIAPKRPQPHPWFDRLPRAALTGLEARSYPTGRNSIRFLPRHR